MRVAAGLTEGADLVVERRPIAVSTWARVMTISISRAPAATEAWISSSRCANGDRPAGKPVETAATGTPLPSSARTAVSTHR